MPVTRPASPAAAATSGFATLVDGIFLVDASSGGTIPDLLGGNPLNVVNAVYTTDAVIGKSLRSSGSGIQVVSNIAPNATIGAYPFAAGCVFTASGVSGTNNGLFSLIDSAGDRQSGGLFAICYYDSAGSVFLTWRVLAGDSPAGVTGIGSVDTSGAINGLGWRVDGNNAITICVNGAISHTVFGAENDASFDATFRLRGTSLLGDVNFSQGTVAFDCDTHLNMSLMWRAHGANPNDAAIQAWTADPWTILAVSGGSTAVTTNGPSSGQINVASTNFNIGVNGATISGTLVVTPHSDKAGTFSPTTVSLTTGSPTATCTFTPTAAGAHSITTTNNGGLTNSTPLTYAVSATASITFTLVASATDSTPQAGLSSLHWRWTDITDVNSAAPPTDEGNTATTNGSGVCTISLPHSALTSGGTGFLEIWNAAKTLRGAAFVTVT